MRMHDSAVRMHIMVHANVNDIKKRASIDARVRCMQTSMWTNVLTFFGFDCLFFFGLGRHRRRARRHERFRHVLQGQLKYLVDPFDRLDIQILFNVFGYLGQLAFVFHRNEHGAYATAMRRKQLFFQAADGQHLAAQRDFSRHRDVGTHGDTAQGRYQCSTHTDARARTILGNSTFGHMDMHVVLLIELRIDTEQCRAAAHHRHRRLHRFLHHLAELTRGGQLAFAGHGGGLNGEQIAAHLGPCETGDLTDGVVLLGAAVAETLHDLAAELGAFALEITYTRFTRVVTNDVAYRTLGDVDLVLLETVGLDLFRYQIAHGDVGLLVFGVTGDADDLHTVKQWGWDVEAVGRADEHHIGEVIIDLEVMIVGGGGRL